jgi:acyl carrier protein
VSDYVFQAIVSAIANRFVFEGHLTLETRFIEDLGADSLDIIQFADDMERIFQIAITLDDLAKMLTIADVADYIENHLQS